MTTAATEPAAIDVGLIVTSSVVSLSGSSPPPHESSSAAAVKRALVLNAWVMSPPGGTGRSICNRAFPITTRLKTNAAGCDEVHGVQLAAVAGAWRAIRQLRVVVPSE